jgi:hydroxymethylpyrimidine/phosphomethylpyrimidine kinase
MPPAAVKTGMLFSAENVRVVAEFFQARNFRRDELHESQISQPHRQVRDMHGSSLRLPPLVVDPVMVSTSGAVLLKPAAVKILKEELLPLATLVTPNLYEAEILTGHKLASVEDLRAAAREIRVSFGCAVLVKGGHLPGGREAVDIFFDGRTELLLSAPLIKGVRTHGTGCACSAAICAALALGHDLPQAVKLAKRYITRAIAGSYHVGRSFALGHFP